MRVISPMEPEIRPKTLRTLSEKLIRKFPATTRDYSMVKIARLDDAYSDLFSDGSKPIRSSITAAKGKKRRKMKGKKKKKQKFKKIDKPAHARAEMS